MIGILLFRPFHLPCDLENTFYRFTCGVGRGNAPPKEIREKKEGEGEKREKEQRRKEIKKREKKMKISENRENTEKIFIICGIQLYFSKT